MLDNHRKPTEEEVEDSPAEEEAEELNSEQVVSD